MDQTEQKHNTAENAVTQLPPWREYERLQKEVRILIWVMTQPANHEKKAVHVRDTWGKRVDKLLFMSTSDGESKH